MYSLLPSCIAGIARIGCYLAAPISNVPNPKCHSMVLNAAQTDLYIYISWMSLSKNDTPIHSHNLGNPCGVCLKILKMCLCLFRAPYPPIYGKFNRENKPSKTGVVLLYQRRSYTSSSAMATKFDKSTIFAQARKDPNFFPLKEYFILGYYEYYS